ncbi:MAG: YlbF family regulator [Verrucomicrobiales bacterium]
MSTTVESPALNSKIRDLCEAILADPGYQSLMGRVDAFLDNEAAKEQYRSVTELSHELQQKQRAGIELEDAEVMLFEKQRDALFDNSTIREFISAQRELGDMQSSLTAWIGKTIELGRLPEPEELADSGGCCGGGGCSSGGCGC